MKPADRDPAGRDVAEREPAEREYDDIPGTFVFDGRRSRMGYALNKFFMSLNTPANREAMKRDPAAYLDQFALTPEQREAVENRHWLRLLELGGNIYYTYKLAAFDGMTFQQLASQQTGVTEEEYLQMMLSGGRSIENNRSLAARTSGEANGARKGADNG